MDKVCGTIYLDQQAEIDHNRLIAKVERSEKCLVKEKKLCDIH